MKNSKAFFVLVVLAAMLTFVSSSYSKQGQNFAGLVGTVKVGDVSNTSTLQTPFIVWGGDMATFYANGGLQTKPGTIFDKQGLKLNLVPGDDFVQQVRDYMSGKSPFLRGTFRMISLASEVIDQDPRTKGVMILQMTWSQGDHMVVKKDIRTVRDLKGKTIVLQQGGPHVGMLDDVLKTAKLSWDDVNIVWAKDLTASANSPAAIFKKRSDVVACFVVTPDMIGLTGGYGQTGSGAEGTVKGARVLVSTAELSRSIADVYVVRKDFYDAHRDLVIKFVAGYLKGAEELVDLKKKYEASGNKQYHDLLVMTQNIYGKEVIPTLDDAHGLLSDCKFVGYPGNVTFFTEANNLHGFDAFMTASLEMAYSQGFVNRKARLMPSGLNYQSKAFIGYLQKTDLAQGQRFKAEAVLEDIESLNSGGVDDRTIYSFDIFFEPNQNDFPEAKYGTDFQRVIEMADKYGGAVIAIRGHADTTMVLKELILAGKAKGIIKVSGSSGNYQYSLNGKPLDIEATEEIVKLIESGAFDGVPEHNPREVMQAALNLSRERAEAVRQAILNYAKSKKLKIDPSQIQAVGVGIREPFVAKPRSLQEAAQNRRVEFVLMRVQAEAVKSSDFDY